MWGVTSAALSIASRLAAAEEDTALTEAGTVVGAARSRSSGMVAQSAGSGAAIDSTRLACASALEADPPQN
jgi:hypothetical protein